MAHQYAQKQVTSPLIQEGIEAAESGNTALALRQLSKATPEERTPVVLSYLAYCLASEQKSVRDALDLCRSALEEDPTHPLIYLNLGRVYLETGFEDKAILALRKGVRYRRHPMLIRKLDSLNTRRRPLFPFLHRSNPLNRITGKLLARIH